MVKMQDSLILSQRQILDSSKLREFADDNFKFDENGGQKSSKSWKTLCFQATNITLFQTAN